MISIFLYLLNFQCRGPLFEFTNGLGQAVYHKCAPSRPRSEWVPDQGQFLFGCAWNNCYGSNG